MTEDEAKTKWCPHARNGFAGSYEHNKRPLGEGTYIADISTGVVAVNTDARCIASACMAWRKTGSKFKDARTGHLADRDLTGHGEWIDTGYCGLAGSPS